MKSAYCNCWSPHALEPYSATREATIMRNLCTTAGEKPMQLEKVCAQLWRPSTDKTDKQIQFKKEVNAFVQSLDRWYFFSLFWRYICTSNKIGDNEVEGKMLSLWMAIIDKVSNFPKWGFKEMSKNSWLFGCQEGGLCGKDGGGIWD